MSRLRVAVVGVGHLGQHHARILAAMPDVELVAVADSRIDRAQLIAEKFGTRAVADYRSLLDDVDAVSVAVPTCFHRDVAVPFLERRVATLVEKPLAGSLAEAEQLTATARAHGAVLQVGHIERFNPAWSLFQENSIRPKYINAERLSTHTFRSTDIGVVLDLMIHDIDLVLSMTTSAVRSVSAIGLSLFGEHEDVANARVEFEDGCVANLTASRASYSAIRKMQVWGIEGFASLDFATRQATFVRPSDRLRQGSLDLEGIDLTQPAAVKEHLFGKVLNVSTTQTEGREPLALELEDFVRAARGLSQPKVDGDDALRSIRLADQILQSLRNHQWASEGTSHSSKALPQPIESIYRGPHSWQTKDSRQANNPEIEISRDR
jgi:predicted dehydrogenase